MQLIGVFLVGLAWATDGLVAERVVGRLDFEGVEAFSPRTLRNVLGWKRGTVLEDGVLEAGMTRLLDFYRQAGYLFAELSVRVEPLGEGVRLLFTVREGKRAQVRAFEIVGGKVLSDRALRRLLGVPPNAPFDEAAWQEGVERILHAYALRGYPFATVTTTVRHIQSEEGWVVLRLIVQENHLVRFERVEFEGLRKTRPEVARRLVPVRENERYDPRRVEETRYRLLNSGYFAEVHPTLVQRGSAEGQVVLRARVTEAQTGRIVGVVGYAPPKGALDAPQLTGLVEALETNLAGTGREVAFRWEAGETRSTRISYREPFLFERPLTASVGWEAERFERSRRQSGVLRFDWQVNTYWTLGLGAQLTRADASEGSGVLVESLYDRRNYRPNPSSGWFLRTRADFVRGGLTVTRYDNAFEAYRRLWGQHVLSVRLNDSRLRGANLPLSERVYLGGTATLRGYREREFRGTWRLVGGVEYRILTGPNSRVFAFVDAGTIGDSRGRLPWRVGYGVGANLESREGMVRFDYGLAPGTSLLKGKVHLRLGTAF